VEQVVEATNKARRMHNALFSYLLAHVGVGAQRAFVAFEVNHVDLVEAHQCHEQPHVRLCQLTKTPDDINGQ
jgi:hypothetical protein